MEWSKVIDTIPPDKTPVGVVKMIDQVKKAGWSPSSVVEEIKKASQRADTAGYIAAVLKGMAASPPIPTTTTTQPTTQRTPRTIHTTSPNLRGMGIGRTIPPHPFEAGLDDECAECQLPVTNWVHT